MCAINKSHHSTSCSSARTVNQPDVAQSHERIQNWILPTADSDLADATKPCIAARTPPFTIQCLPPGTCLAGRRFQHICGVSRTLSASTNAWPGPGNPSPKQGNRESSRPRSPATRRMPGRGAPAETAAARAAAELRARIRCARKIIAQPTATAVAAIRPSGDPHIRLGRPGNATFTKLVRTGGAQPSPIPRHPRLAHLRHPAAIRNTNKSSTCWRAYERQAGVAWMAEHRTHHRGLRWREQTARPVLRAQGRRLLT